ncbi:MAG: methyl-accepting chemotaxis protein [Methanosarcinaceae archaeon]|nr:methyl-accepting chemotaxis protein [Methanosarcinaceae archaeon]
MININTKDLKTKIAIKIIIGFIFVTFIIQFEELTDIPYECFVWNAVIAVVFLIMYLSIQKDATQEKELVENIFKHIPKPCNMVFIDKSNKIQYANDEFAKIRGFKTGIEIQGKTPEEILGVVKSMIGDTLRTGATILNKKREALTDYQGNTIHSNISCIPIKDKKGTTLGALELLIDNTEAVEKQQKLKERTKKMLNSMEKVANGDVDIPLMKMDESDIKKDNDELSNIAIQLRKIITTIVDLAIETEMVANAIIKGELHVRADSSKFGGINAQSIHNVNNMIDAIVEPISETNSMLKSIASGDLSVRMEGDYKGDFNDLKNNFNTSLTNLSDMTSELKNAVEKVESISNESSSSVEQINSGMEQIASASGEIAKGAQETSYTVNESAKELKSVNEILTTVQSNVVESVKVVLESAKETDLMKNKSLESGRIMKNLKDDMKVTISVLDNLDKSVNDIGNATTMIKDIADQTNLLALNAAIEAARAGEHGRGFAVVAEEVRKLAHSSKQSTIEIDNMIAPLKNEMEEVMNAAKRVDEQSEIGSENINKVVTGSNNIANMVMSIESMILEIKEGASEGVTAIEKVSKNIDEIASVSEENAASSEEASSAIEEQTAAVEQMSSGMQELSETAQKAKEMTNMFKLD